MGVPSTIVSKSSSIVACLKKTSINVAWNRGKLTKETVFQQVGCCIASVRNPKISWRHTVVVFKNTAKVIGFKTDFIGYLRNIEFRVEEQIPGFFQADGVHEIGS